MSDIITIQDVVVSLDGILGSALLPPLLRCLPKLSVIALGLLQLVLVSLCQLNVPGKQGLAVGPPPAIRGKGLIECKTLDRVNELISHVPVTLSIKVHEA